MLTIIGDTYAGNGSNRVFAVSFPYLDKAHVKVAVNSVDVSFTWLSPTSIQTTVAPAGGTSVMVYRDTPIDEQTEVFSNGAVLTAEELNRADRQLLYHQQEVDGRVARAIDVITAQTSAEAAASIAVSAKNAAVAAESSTTASKDLVLAKAAEADADAASASASAITAEGYKNSAAASAATATTKAAEAVTSANSAAASAAQAAADAATVSTIAAPTQELIRDTIAACLVAGAGCTIDVDDVADTITVTVSAATGFAFGDLTGAPADNTALSTALGGKSDVGHGHTVANVTGLQAALDGKEPSLAAGTTAQFYRGDKSWQTLNKAAVGLGNVDNTTDAGKPVSTAQAAAIDAVKKTVPVQGSTSGKTLGLTDAGECVPTTGNIVIPANSAVAFPVGTVIEVYNDSAANISISINTDTLRLVGTATVGSRTLAQRGLAVLKKVKATEWVAGGVS